MGDLPMNFAIPVYPGGMTRPMGYSAAIPLSPAPYCVRPAEIRGPFSNTPDGNAFVTENQVPMIPHQSTVLNGIYRNAAPANHWPVMMSPLNFVPNIPYGIPPVPFYGNFPSDGGMMYPMQSNIVGYVVSQQQFGVPQFSYVPAGGSYPMQPVYYEPRHVGGDENIPDEERYDGQQDEHSSDHPASERSYGSDRTDTHGPTASEEKVNENKGPETDHHDDQSLNEGNNGAGLDANKGNDEGRKKCDSTVDSADANREEVIAKSSNSNNNIDRPDDSGREDRNTHCQCSSESATKEEQAKVKAGSAKNGYRSTARQNQHMKEYPSSGGKRGDCKKP